MVGILCLCVCVFVCVYTCMHVARVYAWEHTCNSLTDRYFPSCLVHQSICSEHGSWKVKWTMNTYSVLFCSSFFQSYVSFCIHLYPLHHARSTWAYSVKMALNKEAIVTVVNFPVRQVRLGRLARRQANYSQGWIHTRYYMVYVIWQWMSREILKSIFFHHLRDNWPTKFYQEREVIRIFSMAFVLGFVEWTGYSAGANGVWWQ